MKPGLQPVPQAVPLDGSGGVLLPDPYAIMNTVKLGFTGFVSVSPTVSGMPDYIVPVHLASGKAWLFAVPDGVGGGLYALCDCGVVEAAGIKEQEAGRNIKRRRPFLLLLHF